MARHGTAAVRRTTVPRYNARAPPACHPELELAADIPSAARVSALQATDEAPIHACLSSSTPQARALAKRKRWFVLRKPNVVRRPKGVTRESRSQACCEEQRRTGVREVTCAISSSKTAGASVLCGTMALARVRRFADASASVERDALRRSLVIRVASPCALERHPKPSSAV